LLASHSPEVVDWLRNQGRAYGVRLILATQYPEQLEQRVRTALLSFENLFWYRQSVPQIVSEAVGQLSMLGGEWSASDVRALEQFHAILIATAAGRPQPPVPIRVAYWDRDDRRSRFAADQGYGPAGRPDRSSVPPASAGPGPYSSGGGSCA